MEKRAMAVREEQWLQTIAAAKQSGQPIKVWCAEHGVPVSSFYKWQRKMRDSLLAEEKAEIQFQGPEAPQLNPKSNPGKVNHLLETLDTGNIRSSSFRFGKACVYSF